MLRNILFISFLALAIICAQIGEVRIADAGKIKVYKAEPFTYGFLIAAGVTLLLIFRNINRETKKQKEKINATGKEDQK